MKNLKLTLIDINFFIIGLLFLSLLINIIPINGFNNPTYNNLVIDGNSDLES